MKLILDLQKAGQTSAGFAPKKEDQSIAEYDESFLERPSGVEGGDTYDNPNVGSNWHSGKSADDAVEEKRQKRNAKAQERNLVPTPEEAGTKKSAGNTASDMVKSLTSNLSETLGVRTLTSTEVEFFTVVKGMTLDDIKIRRPTISGGDRHLFATWLCEKLQKSIGRLSNG